MKGKLIIIWKIKVKVHTRSELIFSYSEHDFANGSDFSLSTEEFSGFLEPIIIFPVFLK
jgi:hypothetical protein